MNPHRFVALLMVLFAVLTVPAVPAAAHSNHQNGTSAAQAQFDPIAEVQGWERLGSMVTVSAHRGHGNHAGFYHTPGTPIPQLDGQTAYRLVQLRNSLNAVVQRTRGHVGFHLLPGSYELLVGARNGAISLEPLVFTVPGPTTVPFEMSAVFFDPRSDDFAIRMESSYVGTGKLDYGVGNAETDITGGALYIEASWQQLEWMVAHADYRITAAAQMVYGPNKNWNMFHGGNFITAKVQGVTAVALNGVFELDNPATVQRLYRDWYYLLNGKDTCCMRAAGICGMAAISFNPLVRLMLDNPDVSFTLVTSRHSPNYRYNPTGTDPLLKWKNARGEYAVIDSTVVYPGIDASLTASRPFTMRVTPLIFVEGSWTAFFITEAYFTE